MVDVTDKTSWNLFFSNTRAFNIVMTIFVDKSWQISVIKVWVKLALNTKNLYLVETYFTFLFLKLQSSHMSRKKLKIPINIPTNLLIGSSDFFNSKMKALLNSPHHKWLEFLRHFICLCPDIIIITISFAARTH